MRRAQLKTRPGGTLAIFRGEVPGRSKHLVGPWYLGWLTEDAYEFAQDGWDDPIEGLVVAHGLDAEENFRFHFGARSSYPMIAISAPNQKSAPAMLRSLGFKKHTTWTRRPTWRLTLWLRASRAKS
jgi:hypothetical protein